MYADDTSISYSSKSVDAINSAINNDLSNFKLWVEGNKLSINVSKTQATVGQNSRTFLTVMALDLNLLLMTKLSR